MRHKRTDALLIVALVVGCQTGQPIPPKNAVMRAVMTLADYSESLRCVVFSPDGRTLVTGGGAWHGPGELAFWRPRTIEMDLRYVGRRDLKVPVPIWEAELCQQDAILKPHRHPVLSIAFSKDGKFLATGAGDGDVTLWDAATLKQIYQLRGHRLFVTALVFSADGETLVTADSDDCSIRFWAIATGNPQATFWFAIDESRRLRRYLIPAEKPEERAPVNYSFDEPIEYLYGVAISPDGKLLAAGTRLNRVRLFDVSTGKESTVEKPHKDAVISVAFSPDGKILATGAGGDDKTVCLWDVASGKQLAVLSGHSDSVVAISFSPDGKLLATGGLTNLAEAAAGRPQVVCKIWEIPSGKELATLPGYSDGVRCLAFSPGGKTLATVGDHPGVKLWDLPQLLREQAGKSEK